ncbi:thioredoxin-disulfide reductase [Brachyspira hyodysenteriae]|uniref:Thioredoxin reductase n=1 Tax=Brachyspira hyodysenteriae ATCC 27164 TaxID=1266923 RepID=A0A3B6VUW6_BRAHO|nr:thioredoxin-disulfide reductase [Brachyspira hyodysenteriae]ANN63378.1 thioredoxin-disulfide reductase [Brachyspira hyodysenteriae ATCC 27164]KLI13804.1 thioredoxin reductase [Brachyspira hyodysenteriae]KLI14486.1 thioredoxin reductase [Brachyspira hyodysenteriae]KLI23340.1 thioredoxin reductase [Brachyspira hyodysenteriae]KLI24438.1 thioredoxin reductase [Brachyspira hyodysenteriae]
MSVYDSVIIGGGPAGLSAMLYLGRALTNSILIEKKGIGGQMMSTDAVENYLGFPEEMSAFELVARMQQHAEKFSKNEIVYDEVIKVENIKDEVKKVITADGNTYETKTIILAMGGFAKKLGTKGEEAFGGKGVSYCATCDGAFYRNKTVAVVGGGNSAFDEAYFLTRFVNKIYLVHRRKEFRAEPINVKHLTDTGKVEYVLDSVIDEICGDGKVNSIKIKNVVDGSIHDQAVDGVFVFVGQEPATHFLKDTGLELKDTGHIVTDMSTMETNIPGVFACGDSILKPVRQVANAVGEGAVAAMSVTHYLNKA